jgi:antitoxin component YwqK of YwqJK toxin-antitoxin module
MEQFISKDLIKYIISSYVGYHEILPLVNDVIIFDEHRKTTRTNDTDTHERFIVIIDGFLEYDGFESNKQKLSDIDEDGNNNYINNDFTSHTLQYKNNKLHGLQKKWEFINDYLLHTSRYYMKNGLKHGLSVTKSYTSKDIIFKMCYNKGMKIGWSIENHEGNGNYTQKFYKDDIWTGDIKIYKDNICNVQGNRINGTCKYYYTNTTNIKSIKSYAHKRLEGICTEYYANGKIKYVANFVNGLQHGISKSYDKNGNVTNIEWVYGINLSNNP